MLLIFDFKTSAGRQDRLCFANPLRVHVAHSIGEVEGVVAAVSHAAASGLYAAGFVSYEAAPAFDSALKTRDLRGFPLAWFGVFDAPVAATGIEPAEFRHTPWDPEISRAQYDEAVSEIHAQIADGATYQVNYTFRLRANSHGDALSYYETLRRKHPVGYAAYLDVDSHRLVSLSPELFLRKTGDRLTTQPMKGTAQRGLYPAQDAELAEQLKTSTKERAENVMIVDLMRSDLGRIAATGSVKTPSLFDIEPLPTVWQMTSTVTCETRPQTTLGDIFAATFPPGSVTGAPKPMTMSIIDKLETSPRKVYCGAIGYVAPGGDAVFNVPIRTVVVDAATGDAECGIGSGITSGSASSSEYMEAFAKSKFLNVDTPDFRLLETLLLENGEYYLLERHIQRLKQAAARFCFEVDETAVREALYLHAQNHAGPRRARLLVDRGGETSVESWPIEPGPAVRLTVLASQPIDIDTPFVYYKTTHRAMYEALTVRDASVYDTLLWNDRGEVTEFTRGNIVVRRGGELITPPVSCGLLAGTFRDELLQQGVVREEIVLVEDLPRCSEIWFVNSVRKWVRISLQPRPE